ncbi:MAG: hypothetical protein K0R90_418 [Oscillospiraceae bacterium]|nr:hypothetical protein [Oscillospiraceae bacterium]
MSREEMKKRAFFKKKDLLYILILLIISLLLFMMMKISQQKAGETVAEIYYDGQLVKTIDLSNAKNQQFHLEQQTNVSFEIKNGKIRFVNTICKDKLCEKVGFIGESNQVAVCLPNKVYVKINSNKKSNHDIDIVVG